MRKCKGRRPGKPVSRVRAQPGCSKQQVYAAVLSALEASRAYLEARKAGQSDAGPLGNPGDA